MGTSVGGEVGASRRIHSSDQVPTVIMTIPTFFITSYILTVIVIDTIVSNHFFYHYGYCHFLIVVLPLMAYSYLQLWVS